jgi:hypothetical protein
MMSTSRNKFGQNARWTDERAREGMKRNLRPNPKKEGQTLLKRPCYQRATSHQNSQPLEGGEQQN